MKKQEVNDMRDQKTILKIEEFLGRVTGEILFFPLRFFFSCFCFSDFCFIKLGKNKKPLLHLMR
jgi:hypothetical protein